MKFPSRSALAVLLCGLATPLQPVGSAAPKPTKKSIKAKPTKKPAKKPAAMTAADSAHADSLARASNLAKSAPVRRLDSLRMADSLSGSGRRIDSIYRKELARLTDSIRVADSTRRIRDSIHRLDSLAYAAKTWFVARPRDFSQTPAFSEMLQRRIGIELRHSGRAQAAPGTDTNTTFDGTWKAARASGAGRLFYTAIYAGPSGSRAAVAWIFDLTDGHKLDSSKGDVAGILPRFASDLGRMLVRPVRISIADSTCRADSLQLARRAWAVAVPKNWTPDSSATRIVQDSLVAGLRRSTRASWATLDAPDSCRKRHCLDSTAASAGIERVIHSVLSRTADSTWILSLWVARSSDDSTIDSTRVTDMSPTGLAARALASLLPPPPPACAGTCPPPDSRALWTYHLSSDFGSKAWVPSLQSALAKAFRGRTDRQFLSLPNPVALGLDSIRLDSLARAAGATKLVRAALSGSDSTSHSLVLRVTDLRTGTTDTTTFRRGGKQDRVVPWFARHAAELQAPGTIPCGDLCRSDSARRSRTTWTIVNAKAADSVAGAILADRLTDAFVQRATGRLVALPEPLPCREQFCIDSIAQSRQVRYAVWPSFSRAPDSSWKSILRVRDVASEDWTDSVALRDTGAVLDAITRMASGAWDSLTPRPKPCDSCVSTDTLESALAIAAPVWNGAPDSLRGAFIDTLARILSREGSYQIIRKGVDSSLVGDSALALARLRCRTGASHLLRTSAVLGPTGWTIQARIVDVPTGAPRAAASVQDKSKWAGRPAEISPWLAHKLLGTDTAAAPPKSRHRAEIPWSKILLLGIPLLAGTISVIYHW